MDNDLSKSKLFEDIRVLIEESRTRVAATVNTEMSFYIGKLDKE